MILHLTEDEKFIDHVIDVFEEANPLGNIYFVELQENADKLKYVKSSHPNMFVGRVDGEKFRSLVDDLTKYDAVVLHNLYNPYKQNIVRNAPDTVHFHWMCWGADLYCIDELRSDFIDGDKERYRIFDSCGIVVMNHIRQQALGIVVFALWKGAKLYMNRKSPIYRHLKDNGIQVYPIGWRRLKPAKDNQQLAWKNRDRLMALYGREVVVDETKALVRYLIGE